jgi:hypothetical protein
MPQPVRVCAAGEPGPPTQVLGHPCYVAGIEPGWPVGGPVEPHEERARPVPPRRDPVGQRRGRRRIERHRHPLGLPLADDRHHPRLQVHVAQVERHDLAPRIRARSRFPLGVVARSRATASMLRQPSRPGPRVSRYASALGEPMSMVQAMWPRVLASLTTERRAARRRATVAGSEGAVDQVGLVAQGLGIGLAGGAGDLGCGSSGPGQNSPPALTSYNYN